MKMLRLFFLSLITMILAAVPAFAQEYTGVYVFSGLGIGAGLGAALTIVGAGFGFGKIGSAALESMARQPEIAGRVQTGMIIIAALLEGATFFSLIVCIILANNAAGL